MSYRSEVSRASCGMLAICVSVDSKEGHLGGGEHKFLLLQGDPMQCGGPAKKKSSR